MEYRVHIKEILSCIVPVEAENPEEARYIVEHDWKDREYVLDASNFQTAYFTVLEDPKKFVLLEKVKIAAA